MKIIITERQYKIISEQTNNIDWLITEAPSPPIESMGNHVNDAVNDWISNMKRIGIVNGASKAGVNILLPIEQLRNYVLSLLPKKWTDISTTGEGGNEFRNNIINKIYELTKSEITKIPVLKRKAAKALMFAKYGGKEKYIQTQTKNWGGETHSLIHNLVYSPSKDLFGVSEFHLDYKNPQHLKWINYTSDSIRDQGKKNKDFLRQLLGLIWDSL